MCVNPLWSRMPISLTSPTANKMAPLLPEAQVTEELSQVCRKGLSRHLDDTRCCLKDETNIRQGTAHISLSPSLRMMENSSKRTLFEGQMSSVLSKGRGTC